MIHYLSHIKENHALNKVSDDILIKLLSFAQVKTLVPKDKVMNDWGGDNNFYFIVKGIVKAVFIQNGDQYCSQFYKSGDIIMDFKSVFSMKESLIDYECVTHVTTVYVEKEIFHKFMEEYDSVKYVYIENMAADILKYEERVRLLLCYSAKERYKKFVEQFGDYISHFTQKDIASYLSIKPETLSRIKRNVTG